MAATFTSQRYTIHRYLFPRRQSPKDVLTVTVDGEWQCDGAPRASPQQKLRPSGEINHESVTSE
jgi:hypothetical protein